MGNRFDSACGVTWIEEEGGKKYLSILLCKYVRKEASTAVNSMADTWWKVLLLNRHLIIKGIIQGDPMIELKYAPAVYYTTHSK